MIRKAISNIQEALKDQESQKKINYKNLTSKQIFVRWQVTFPTLNLEYIKADINHLFSNFDLRSCRERTTNRKYQIEGLLLRKEIFLKIISQSFLKRLISWSTRYGKLIF